MKHKVPIRIVCAAATVVWLFACGCGRLDGLLTARIRGNGEGYGLTNVVTCSSAPSGVSIGEDDDAGTGNAVLRQQGLTSWHNVVFSTIGTSRLYQATDGAFQLSVSLAVPSASYSGSLTLS